ncbi:MAG: type II toxin-antitoxin system VapB family antitoxin [Pseudomonadota bacterium]
MKSAHTKLFKSNQSQAVRLPKRVALPESVTEVEIIAIGVTRLITPVGGSWDSWFDLGGVSDDFMAARDQPDDQERGAF